MSPYQMMGPQQTPPDFTRTAAGDRPGQQLSKKAEQLGAEISDLTLVQARLKHQKDQMTRQKSAYEQLLNRLKESV